MMAQNQRWPPIRTHRTPATLADNGARPPAELPVPAARKPRRNTSCYMNPLLPDRRFQPTTAGRYCPTKVVNERNEDMRIGMIARLALAGTVALATVATV